MMKFGQEFRCHICKGDIDNNYHRYYCDIAGMDLEFFVHDGDCNAKFRGEYVDPFEPIDNRFEILDL